LKKWGRQEGAALPPAERWNIPMADRRHVSMAEPVEAERSKLRDRRPGIKAEKRSSHFGNPTLRYPGGHLQQIAIASGKLRVRSSETEG